MNTPCGVIGQTVLWNEEKYSVVGVAPAEKVGAGFGVAVLLIAEGQSMYVNDKDVQLLTSGDDEVMTKSAEPRTKTPQDDLLNYELTTLGSYDVSDIEDGCIDVYGEDADGNEGSWTVSIPQLARLACGRINHQDSSIKELEAHLFAVTESLKHFLHAAKTEEGLMQAVMSAETVLETTPKQSLESVTRAESLQTRSGVLADGMPTFYISIDGDVCTHRLGEDDVPVWCKSGEDGFLAMGILAGIKARKNLIERDYKTEDCPETIASTLRKARLRLNMTQGNMADLLGISTSQWSAVENAKQEPK
ncbi:helix-turn-helix transcriptional regulator [Neptunomonas japonica]|uniref:HTH cro/C1-type domain-containing protein n=1 Tax=Neptunomonas japonica JAMM 1380 TaxID=1441457 RepID=A0A7R6SVF6_9GAMM|nr:helix-turn-helix transcriptional regulator [Neptunomonas japonica]BBB29341.1 hypothetical protein NEJAP_1389 [Neptunomonas japonica JAMM 1380]